MTSKPLDLAMRYMEIFFAGRDPDELGPLFSSNFSFQGPMYRFDNAAAYIESLKQAPPQDCNFTLIESFERDNKVCLIYRFSKPDISEVMAQLFTIESDRISRILLIFDSQPFTRAN